MPAITINGPQGRLESQYQESPQSHAPVALILGAHPKEGGTMNHLAVYALYKVFADRGFNTIRFNYHGVERSEGKFEEEDAVSDAASVLDWLQLKHPHSKTYFIAGFSFGAWVAMQLLMRRPEFNSFICVSLPANQHDFTFLAPCPVSGLILQGKDDRLVPLSSVERVVDKLRTQRGITIDYRCFDNTDHFFTGKLNLMIKTVGKYVDAMEEMPKRAANF